MDDLTDWFPEPGVERDHPCGCSFKEQADGSWLHTKCVEHWLD